MEKRGIKIAAQNRKAYHDYFVEERYEAGIELAGTEVKSIRGGRVNLKDSYCVAKDGELFALSMHISPYEQGNIFNKDPDRPKRLLMHKREILRLFAKIKQDGYTLVQELRDKEVIHVGEGARLGYVNDLVVDICCGRGTALIVPGPCRFLGLFGREDDYVIPWLCIKRIGDDLILVDGPLSEWRTPRKKRSLF